MGDTPKTPDKPGAPVMSAIEQLLTNIAENREGYSGTERTLAAEVRRLQEELKASRRIRNDLATGWEQLAALHIATKTDAKRLAKVLGGIDPELIRHLPRCPCYSSTGGYAINPLAHEAVCRCRRDERRQMLRTAIAEHEALVKQTQETTECSTTPESPTT